MNVELTNTSVFPDSIVEKGINRLMNSPILDCICSMSNDKWEMFQREFFDYYYEGKENKKKNNEKEDIKNENEFEK